MDGENTTPNPAGEEQTAAPAMGGETTDTGATGGDMGGGEASADAAPAEGASM